MASSSAPAAAMPAFLCMGTGEVNDTLGCSRNYHDLLLL